MSDTPETDAMEYIDSMCDKEKFVESQFARKLERELNFWKSKHDAILKDRNNGIYKAAELLKELKGWKEAAYALKGIINPAWDDFQPPAAELAKFKEMVELQHEKDKKHEKY